MKSILVVNSGSSSLKYALFRPEGSGLSRDARGLIERIGEPEGNMPDHGAALTAVVERLAASGTFDKAPLIAIGHRVVHGGERYLSATVIDPDVIEGIEAAAVLAPLHNPANLLGIRACLAHWPSVLQVAVFDTAFHHSLPASAYRYAIPEEPAGPARVRRYGFHGTSFESALRTVSAFLGRAPETLNLLVLHLGNGASVCAIREGKSVDTSMGMTPTAGLVMGTRTGDLDPGIISHWLRTEDLDSRALDDRINHQGGLKALAGTNDMRLILARVDAGDSCARAALEVFVHRLRHYIGAYRAALPRLDALVFTGGIGEHAPLVRSETLKNLDHLGFVLDEDKNHRFEGGVGALESDGSGVRILVVPADEELEIARQVKALQSSAVEAF